MKHSDLQNKQMRERIAQAAARLIAEDGMLDFSSAKRKAARQIGAADTHNLPSNTELQLALKAYQALYHGQEQPAQLRQLREEALRFMRQLADFNPLLTGSVLTGTASRHSDINLAVFADSSKEIELYLLKNAIPFETGERRLKQNNESVMIPVFTLSGNVAEVHVAVHDPNELRRNTALDSKTPDRAKIKQVEALLAMETK
jgi:hypothetical protein